MTNENSGSSFPGKEMQSQLEQKLEENRQQQQQYNQDIKQKRMLLAKLNMEIDELNKQYPGHRR